MRYGPIAEDALEERMLASPAAPKAVFDSFIPLVQASALMAGVRLGVFEGLRDAPRGAGDLAVALDVDADTLQLVLRVLSASNYLTAVNKEQFALTGLARKTLLGDSPARLTANVALNEMWWDTFVKLGDVLRSGRGLDAHQELLRQPAEWRTYQAAMLENARQLAPLVARTVPVRTGATRLLDIGGSHGLYGALISRAHPPMRSEVLDLPSAVEQARELASAEGLDDVVTHRAGDVLTDDLGTGYDVVFLSNILHIFSPPQIGALLARARAAMNSAGTVAIWDGRQPEAGETPDAIVDAFSLFFRLISTGRNYTTGEFTRWLTDAGFTDVQVHSLPVVRSLILVTGRAS